jgi:catechol 2,3-dioxygenase-like lactoylglutathione lyase family enzyme
VTLETIRILRIELTVSDLTRAEQFYVERLGFTALSHSKTETTMATLLGANHITAIELQRNNQTLVLQQFQPPGEPYPHDATSSDQVFQHFALPVTDMQSALARLQPANPPHISNEPQHLPARSGGATAFKFRDPDRHPLELIEFPDGHNDGIDHSAIVVMDVERSIAFYRDHLGFHTASRQINTGPEQDQLDALQATTVEVVALTPAQPSPHLELLAYRNPAVRPTHLRQPRDIAATRLVLEMKTLPPNAALLADGQRAMLIHDPDHHALLLLSK